jgi:23S rRNA (guanine745-N1)-methyltransferase
VLMDVLAYLTCPLCGSHFVLAESSLRCVHGHTYDVARQGYVNLVAGDAKASTGDTLAMVRARDDFLSAGHYATIARAVADVAAHYCRAESDGCVLDVGAGTGYYLAHVLDRLPGRMGLALDASKHAARYAARAHTRAGAIVCDTWGALPVLTDSAALILNVFAPRNVPEFRRVLIADGVLLVVTPTQNHLCELVEPLGLLNVDARKEERLGGQLAGLFRQVESLGVEVAMRLSHAEIEALAAMGPSAWHARGTEVQERIAELPEPIEVTASVTVSAYAVRG